MRPEASPKPLSALALGLLSILIVATVIAYGLLGPGAPERGAGTTRADASPAGPGGPARTPATSPVPAAPTTAPSAPSPAPPSASSPTPVPLPTAAPVPPTPAPPTPVPVWTAAGEDRLTIRPVGGAPPVTVEVGMVPFTPNQWCVHDRVYRSHIRLEDEGVPGATFGVAAPGVLAWIPPEDAGCVDWARVGPRVNFPKEVIMGFRLQRLQSGALLWVLDGDPDWRGRLYQVDRSGQAHYVSRSYLDANEAQIMAAWKDVLPVSWVQVSELEQRGLIGPPL